MHPILPDSASDVAVPSPAPALRSTSPLGTRPLCIDFEGEGRRRDGTTPRPVLLGALVPRLGRPGADYRVWLLDPALDPMARSIRLTGPRKYRKTSTLEAAIADVLVLAHERNCRIAAYSCHELEMVRLHLGEAHPACSGFESRFWNVKRDAEKLLARRDMRLTEGSLKSVATALLPRFQLAPPPSPSVAECCRKLRSAGRCHRRWRRWSQSDRQRAVALLRYNRSDCKAVARLARLVGAEERARESG